MLKPSQGRGSMILADVPLQLLPHDAHKAHHVLVVLVSSNDDLGYVQPLATRHSSALTKLHSLPGKNSPKSILLSPAVAASIFHHDNGISCSSVDQGKPLSSTWLSSVPLHVEIPVNMLPQVQSGFG